MIKKVIVSICLFFTIVTFAQEGTASAYSFYGIGDIRFKGTAENRSMGGLSIFPDSTHINLQNPASFGRLNLTTLTLGGTYNTTNLKTNTDEGKARRTTIDYLAVGLPVSKKLGVGFGLMPYSSVGYKIQSNSVDENDPTNRYNGNGGVNRVFFTAGYKLNAEFSVGATVDYNFGQIETTSLEFLPFIQYGTRELNTSDVSGFSFNTGLMWNKKINKKLDVFASLIYTPESDLKLSNERNIAVVQLSSTGEPIVIDDEDIDVANTTIKLPSKFAFGAGIGEVRKWLVGAEVTLQQTGDFANRFNDINDASFENSTRISFGGYYIPDFDSYSSYLNRMTFRGGFRHENTGLIINNKSIDDTAFTLGLGFPVTGSFSSVNFGVEFGKKGTKAANLVEEKYINFTLSLSLNDKWFVKRKYN